MILLQLFAAVIAIASDPVTPMHRVTNIGLSYDTVVRVESPVRIVEAHDPSLTGQSTSAVFSLRYAGGTNTPMDLEFPSQAAIEAWLPVTYCSQIQRMLLNPIREAGKKGAAPLEMSLTPFSVSAQVIEVTAKGRVYSVQQVCRQPSINP